MPDTAEIKESTEVIYGEQETTERLVKALRTAKHKFDVMASSAAPSITFEVPLLRETTLALFDRGVQIRYLTEITKENLSYCKELAKIAEVRHLNGIKGGFGLTESDFIASATLQEKKPVSHLIWSNVKEIIQQQSYAYEALWSRGLPAAARFEELRSGRMHEFMRIIEDADQIGSLFLELASSFENEVLLILPSAWMLNRKLLPGFFEYLADRAKSKRVQVRIISPLDSTNVEVVNWLRDSSEFIKLQDGSSSNRVIFVADNNFLGAELRNRAETFEKSLGFTVYSNSRPTADSFKSLFEMIWNHLEITEKLKSLGKSREEFISVAAHELRSPITPIMLMADLWKKGKARDDASVRMLAKSAEKLDTLIRDVLEVSRIENHSLTLEKTCFDLNKLGNEIVADTQIELDQEGKGDKVKLKLENEHTSPPVMVNADRSRIVEVISNLLSNALKFTEQGTISISVGIKDNQAMLTVRDEGKGIHPDILPKLFTKYATKSHMGTGIGLYVSKNIIEAHGGRIWADNNSDGKGASFSFTLPIAVAQAA